MKVKILESLLMKMGGQISVTDFGDLDISRDPLSDAIELKRNISVLGVYVMNGHVNG
jgi:hypothetical protein